MNKDKKAQLAIEETEREPVDGRDHPPAGPHDKAISRMKARRREPGRCRTRAMRACRRGAAEDLRTPDPQTAHKRLW